MASIGGDGDCSASSLLGVEGAFDWAGPSFAYGDGAVTAVLCGEGGDADVLVLSRHSQEAVNYASEPSGCGRGVCR